MIWDRILNAELAEPAIREVHLNFATDQTLRADRKDISHDQHPDHQFRIDRRPTHGRIMRCKFAAEPGKIESSIDLPHQMIFGNCVIELKLVEKLRLFALQPSHHGLPPPRFLSARWNHGSPQPSTDFCNKICTFRARPVQLKESACRGRTDLAETSADVRPISDIVPRGHFARPPLTTTRKGAST